MQRLEVSGAVRPIYGSLGVKGLSVLYHFHIITIACLYHTHQMEARSVLCEVKPGSFYVI